MTFASRVLAGMGAAFPRRAGALLEPLVDALTSGVQTAAGIVGTKDKPFPDVFHLDRTPYPSFVGAATGTPVPGGLSLEAQRAYVRDRPAQRRGTPGAIREAVKATLVGSKRVELVERTPNVDTVTVQVYSSEAPDTAKAESAARSQKPVGLLLTFNVLTGATYSHMTTTHGPSYGDFSAAFATYTAARDHTPEA